MFVSYRWIISFIMNALTKAEEQVMQILWNEKEGFVKELLEHFPEPKPAYNTVSTIIRILEKKGFGYQGMTVSPDGRFLAL